MALRDADRRREWATDGSRARPVELVSRGSRQPKEEQAARGGRLFIAALL